MSTQNGVVNPANVGNPVQSQNGTISLNPSQVGRAPSYGSKHLTIGKNNNQGYISKRMCAEEMNLHTDYSTESHFRGDIRPVWSDNGKDIEGIIVNKNNRGGRIKFGSYKGVVGVTFSIQGFTTVYPEYMNENTKTQWEFIGHPTIGSRTPSNAYLFSQFGIDIGN